MRRPLLPVLLVLGVAAALAIAPALAAAAVPSVTFAAPATTAVPGSSGALQGTIATADFNRDGHADVAAYSSNYQTEEGSLDVWLSSVGSGSTSWSWAATPLTTPSVPRFEAGFVATGQMNPETDSDPDLVALSVSGEEGESVLGVYLGTGVGTFQAPLETSLPGYANGRPTIADVNDDGIPDVLIPTLAETSTGWESEVVTLIGKGEGQFEAPIVSRVEATIESEPYESVYATGVAVGEFTGGGHLDLAVSQGYGSPHDLVVMGGDGAGNFVPADYLSLGKGSTGVAGGDFDGSGHDDLAVPIGVPSTDHPGFDSAERVGLAFGNGLGLFTQSTPETPQWAAENPYSYTIATADLNGDGKPDLLLPVGSEGASPNGVWALLDNGDGTFTETSRAELEGGNAWDAEGADFDGDGHPDVVALVSTGSELELKVYDNTSEPSFGLGASTVDAGTVEVGGAGTATLPLTNSGNYALSISALTVSGTDAAGFTVSGCATIAPGATCDATVTFRPSRIGAESATLTIATDDPANPTATVALSGTGEVTTTANVPGNGTSGGAGGGKKGGSASAAAGKLKLPKTATVSKNGKASLKLTCSGGTCTGKLALTIATRKKVKGKAKTVVVPAGSASYSLAAGKSKTITVKLPAKAKKLLAAAAGHKLKATVTVTPKTGARSTAKLTLEG